MDKAEAEYLKMKKKYKLPEWSWIEKNFPFKPEEHVPILNQVRKSVSEKLNNIITLIEPLIAAGESYRAFFEKRMLTQEEKERLFEIYKDIQHLLWLLDASFVANDDEQFADWLTKMKEKWNKLKPETVKICEKLAKGWEAYKKSETEGLYHG